MFEKVNPAQEWRDVVGFDGYKVSSDGLVYSVKRRKILKPFPKKKYMLVYLYGECGRRCKLVHRLVAEAFIDNPLHLPEVNHKDEDTFNNRADNLEWCTRQYNASYGTLPDRMREKALENNPFSGKHHTDETKAKMRAAKLGRPSLRKRKVTICGVTYESVADAMGALKISTRKLYKLLEEGNHVREGFAKPPG